MTADGRARRVDADADEDLYWACRGGGGGNFGIVTSLTLRAHRARGAAWFFIRFPWEPGERGAGGLAALRARCAAGAHVDLHARHRAAAGRPASPRSASSSARSPRCARLIRPLARVDGAAVSSGSSSMLSLVLRWAGCLDEGYRACHTRGTSPGGTLPRASFYAKSDYFDEPLPARGRQTMIDWVERRQRTPSQGSGALILDAYGGAYNRPGRRRHRLRAPGHAVLAPVRRLLQRQRRARAAAGSTASGGRCARTPPARPTRTTSTRSCATWRQAYYASNLAAAARDQEAGRPGLHVPLPPGDPAGRLMDRVSLRRLRAQPGYLPFVQRRDAGARLGRDVLGRRRAARARPHRQRRPGRAWRSPRSRCRA